MSQKKRVLLYDDDPDFLLQNKIELTSAGFEVLDTDNLERVEQILAESPPDIAVVDLMTEAPDTGLTLCYRIKREHPDLPVIIATGLTGDTGIDLDVATHEERAWIKADLLLAKPLRFEQLLAAIELLLKKREEHHDAGR